MSREILDPVATQQHEDKPVGSWAASCNGSAASVPPALDLPFPSMEFSEAEVAYNPGQDVQTQLTAMTGQAEQTISHLGMIFGLGGKRKVAEVVARGAAKVAKNAYKTRGPEAASGAYRAYMDSRAPSQSVALRGFLNEADVAATIRSGNLEHAKLVAKLIQKRKQEIAAKGIERVREEDKIWRSLHVYDGLLR